MLLLCLRRYFYEFFIKTHYGLAIFAVYALWKHVAANRAFSRIYIFVAAASFTCTSILQMLNLIVRNVGWGRLFAQANVVVRNDAVKIVLTNLKPFKPRPGQFVYLRLLDLGRFTWLENHPFGIIWHEGKDGRADSISLLAKARGDFTDKLLRHATTKHNFLACVEGPYGGTIDLSRYGCVLMFATGIGIAAQVPYIREILERRLRWESPTRRLVVAWEIDREGTPRMFTPHTSLCG